MATSLRMPVIAVAGAPAVRTSRAAFAVGARRPAGRRVVLRRSQNGADKLDLDRVAKIEEEITRQARSRCGCLQQRSPNRGLRQRLAPALCLLRLLLSNRAR